MDIAQKERFQTLWARYFPGAELPVVFYYSDDAWRAKLATRTGDRRCFISQLAAVRKGNALCFDIEAIGCAEGAGTWGSRNTLDAELRVLPFLRKYRGNSRASATRKRLRWSERSWPAPPNSPRPRANIVFKAMGRS